MAASVVASVAVEAAVVAVRYNVRQYFNKQLFRGLICSVEKLYYDKIYIGRGGGRGGRGGRGRGGRGGGGMKGGGKKRSGFVGILMYVFRYQNLAAGY